MNWSYALLDIVSSPLRGAGRSARRMPRMSGTRHSGARLGDATRQLRRTATMVGLRKAKAPKRPKEYVPKHAR